MKIHVKNNVSWIGKTDWELRMFHGQEYSAHRGTTYNSYLIEEEKTAVIDTVWKPFAGEYVENLKKEVDLQKIDYVIANHAEIDHSGALPLLMAEIPDVPIYCTKNGVKSLKGHYHQNWNFAPVKTGDKISLGDKQLVFVEAPMLHWPDTMMCYLTGDNVLFSNDAFGQHYASEYLFNDMVNQDELFTECIKYFANILTPFSPLVIRKIEEFLSFSLPLDVICSSHGVVWRDNPVQIVERYMKWAAAYQENQIAIIYDTMWDGTRRMAEAIAQGIKEGDGKVNIKIFNSGRADKNDIITEVFKSKAVLIGSPTINRGVLSSTASLIEIIKGLQFNNKKAAAFGCYGWSGESVDLISHELKEAGFEMLNNGLKVAWNPDPEAMDTCREFGKEIAAK